jgi:hypothetical protein
MLGPRTVLEKDTKTQPVDRRAVAGWVLLVLAGSFWAFFFGVGAWNTYVTRPSGIGGFIGPFLMLAATFLAMVPALIGTLVGRGRSRTVNLLLFLCLLLIWASFMEDQAMWGLPR